MECPKCGGGSFLVDEELIKVLENTEPMKIILKATYQCRACGERFGRIVYDNLDARKKTPEAKPAYPVSQPQEINKSYEEETVEGLRFF
ncbi:MAG: hypothetical protein DRP15_02445 [Candidatus Aenigmatarchaeota archaeon]|nr:MAG: hypothetical protein DRP15_02445 [Candidatus Aenigmarchaeota archaeon]